MQPVQTHGADDRSAGSTDGGDGVWTLDAAVGTVLSVNRAAAALVGARPDELVGASFPLIVDPPLSTEGWRLMADHADGGRSHRVTVGISAGPAGAPSQVDLELTRQRSGGDDIVTVLSRPCPRPVAEAGHLQHVLAVLDVGVAVVDRSGRIDDVNDAFAGIVGRPVDQILHRSVFDPPWVLRDERGSDLSPEASPAAHAIRSGEPSSDGVFSIATSRTERRHCRMTAHPTADGGAIVVLDDLTNEVRLDAEMRALRDLDELTGLGNRRRTMEALVDALGSRGAPPGPSTGGPFDVGTPAEGNGNRRVGVLHLDLDSFRTVNDTFGPAVGDVVLAEVAERLRDLAERGVHVGRIGVDEMLLVVSGSGPSLAFDGELRCLADEVQRRLHAPALVDGLEIRLTSSIGVARAPGDATDAEGLVVAARQALDAGRSEGSSRIRFYEPSLDAATRTGLALDRDLRMAAAARQLDVHYQPIIDLRTGAVAMAEALVRWHHPEEGPISPAVFIPTAEATGSIGAVSDLVVSTVARDVAAWTRDGILPHGARIAVNISPTEFEQPDFTERLAATLAHEGVTPSQLELEITESLLVQDLRAAAARLEVLDDMGFLIALDDFGTGYSSLSYLHSLPFHTLKIDRRFVGDLRDDRSGTITRAILTLAHNLGIVAVAEGVETDGQRRFLTHAGCDLVQGFLYAPPLPRVAFERFLAEQGGVVQLPTPSEAGATGAAHDADTAHRQVLVLGQSG